jgi:hypothetical protein
MDKNIKQLRGPIPGNFIEETITDAEVAFFKNYFLWFRSLSTKVKYHDSTL